MILCEFCDEDVDTKRNGVYSKHMCWTLKRQAGGANSMTLPTDPLGWAHGSCIDIQVRARKTQEAPSMNTDVSCWFCQEPVDAGAAGHYSKHVAWQQHRVQGGANQAALPSEALGWAHRECVQSTKKEGEVNWSGESLF